MELPQAIRELRTSIEKSQQVFATELGIAIRTLQHWEGGVRPPPIPQLLILAVLAEQIQRGDLYEAFMLGVRDHLMPVPLGYELQLLFFHSQPGGEEPQWVRDAKRIKVRTPEGVSVLTQTTVRAALQTPKAKEHK